MTAKPIRKYLEFFGEVVTTLNDQVGILLTIKSPINTKYPHKARDGNKSPISNANEKYIGSMTKRAAAGAGTPTK